MYSIDNSSVSLSYFLQARSCTIRYPIDNSSVSLTYFLQARSCMYDKIFTSQFQCFLILLLTGYAGWGHDLLRCSNIVDAVASSKKYSESADINNNVGVFHYIAVG